MKEERDGMKETEIGLIPEDWEVVKIKDVSEKLKAGGTPKRSVKEYWNGDIPFALIEDLTSCGLYLKKTKETITQDGLNNSNAWIVPPNSLLLSMYATIGETAINKIPVATNQAILAIIPNERLNNIYGAYLLKFNSQVLQRQNIQSTQKNINKGIVENFKIPLPPLDEQKKIAYVLSTIQEAKEKTEQVIEATKALKKSLMKHLFTYGSVPLNEVNKVKLKETEIGVLRKEWKLVELGEVASKRSEKVDPKNEKAIYIGLEHIIPGKIKLEKFGYSKEVKSTKLKFYNGDILYAKLRPYLDKGALAEFKGICSTDIIVINPKRNIINPKYLAYLVHSSFFLEYATRSMTGVNHPRTNWSSLKKFKIPFPSLEEQKKIANILSTIDKKIEAEENKKKALEELFKSMLHNLMTGKIRVKDLEVS
ncbi:MAG: restriction endonuclease subunit S [Thermosipho sp. (in: Bacteria)]|nr:restriction endonuclease subunit S [Thermosipho sp. (in: thermotogales)]